MLPGEDDPYFKGKPHDVEILPSVRGSVVLIGYDRSGDVMVEFRMPRSRLTQRIVDRLARWVRDNDDGPTLGIIR